MKVCCAGMAAPPATVADGLALAGKLAGEARAAGADLLLLPEQFATGWSATEPRAEPHILPALFRTAVEHGIWVVGSCYEGYVRPRNMAYVISPEGRIAASYAKVHLFSPDGEDRACTPGTTPATFEAGGARFALAICYDLRFPALFTHYAACGVDCVLVPAAWPAVRLSQWDLLVRARALDGEYYVAGANAGAGSCIAGPDGELVGEERGDLVLAEIDLTKISAMRVALPVMKDRRPHLYTAWKNTHEW
ncbi:carbon-nitrogen hydrolase family protein [uncultured Methanofollis sp.]|uniref:carbon-nitrogen hydrolase family protein n=1 Tax=uncultured Methanofollis sp. TaxID=262500 RepID=UPI002620B6EC|nr:nitrilase-related carbon-nitrogen hydrolase [uncultured Methanofollis sp.]